jgi:multidrug resistance protein, MATE family
MSFPSIFFRFLSEAKASLSLSLPLVVTEMIYGLNGFIGNIFVAHLGKEVLAANALVWNIFITLMLFFIGILSAVCILVAHSYGAKDVTGARRATQQGIILALIFSVPMMLCLYYAPEFLLLTGQNQEIIKIATPCFHVLALAMLPLSLFVVQEQFLVGIGLTRLAMSVSIITVPLYIFFFYVFAFGKFGAPAEGLTAMAVSSIIVNIVATLLMAFYIQFSRRCRAYKVFSDFWLWRKKYILEMLRVGLPIGATYTIEIALFAVFAMLMGRIGTDTLAANQVAVQFLVFGLTFLFGSTQGVAIRVGHKVGENDKAGLIWVVYTNIIIGLLIMVLFGSIFLVFPKQIIGIDLDVNAAKNQQLVLLAVNFLAIAAVSLLFDCLRLTAVSSLRALKDTKIPMLISVVCYWFIAFPLAYFLAFHLKLGGIGIWLAIVCALGLAAMLLNLRFITLVRKINLVGLVMRS